LLSGSVALASFMRLSEKKQVLDKPRLVFGTAGSTTKRRVPHPLRSLQRVGYATAGIEIRGIPPFAKSAKDGAPGDLLHFLLAYHRLFGVVKQ
jgi:hypothetical protein